jgi:hypothetical protein
VTPLESLNQTTLVVWLQTNPYAYPSLEVAHIVGLALVFGTVWVVDMRLLGWMRAFDAQMLARQVLPWTLLGFSLAAATGLLLFVSQAADLIANPAFLTKMLLLFAAASNAAILHARGPLQPDNGLTRAQAFLSLLIWVALIASGRWIAYV